MDSLSVRPQRNLSKKPCVQIKRLPQRGGISTGSTELLLARMRASLDGLCEKRDAPYRFRN